MEHRLVLYPLLAQVALTFGVALWYVKLRFQAVRSGELPAHYFLLNRGARLPHRLELVGHNYQNLLELPILFYAAILTIVVTHRADLLHAILAWSFVATRLIHTLIHTGANRLRPRALVFLMGAAILIAIWARLGVQLIAE